jgi:hypothetical protein
MLFVHSVRQVLPSRDCEFQLTGNSSIRVLTSLHYTGRVLALIVSIVIHSAESNRYMDTVLFCSFAVVIFDYELSNSWRV